MAFCTYITYIPAVYHLLNFVDFAVVYDVSYGMIALTCISIAILMLLITMLGQDGYGSILLHTTDNDPNSAVEVREALKS